MEFRVGVFYVGLHMGLLLVPSCGYWGIGCYGFGSSGRYFLGFYLWVLGWLRVEV